jgi:tetratricopeptide (TPR) repeat protein
LPLLNSSRNISHVIKLTKKDLKTPDQIWQASRSTLTWMTDRFTILVVACVLFFFAIVGVVYFYHVQQGKEGDAQLHYSKARNFLEDLKSGTTKKPEEISKTRTDLNQQLEILSNTYSKSLANRLANQIRAQLAAGDKKWTDAISFYQQYEKALPGSEKELALLPLGHAYEQANDFQNALKTYDEVLVKKNNVFSPIALLGKARALRSLNKLDEARTTYETFLEQHPDSPDVAEVRGLLAMVRDEPKK